MTLKSRIQNDMISHMKAGNTFERDVLRFVLGAIQSAEKGGKTPVEFNDAKVEALLNKEVKTRVAVAQTYENAGETARAEKELAEAKVILNYLPQQLSQAEVEVIINTAFAAFENPTKADKNSIMKAVTGVIKGRFDGKQINSMVEARLS